MNILNNFLQIGKIEQKCSIECRNTRTEDIDIMLLDSVHGYFSSVYNTLISVMCGISLAILLSPENINLFFNETIGIGEKIFFSIRMLLVFMTICTVWHHYILNNKYIFWNIRLRDTILPFSWSISLITPISLLDNTDGKYFIYFLSINYLLGVLAYMNSYHNIKNKKNQFLIKFKKDYNDNKKKEEDEDKDLLHICLYNSLYNFHLNQFKMISLSANIVIFISVYISIFNPKNISFHSLIALVIHFSLIYYLLIPNIDKAFVKDLQCIDNDSV